MINLALFFTLGNGLDTWDRFGILEREVALYRKLADHGVKTTFVTYGGREETRYKRDLEGIDICCNRFGLPEILYQYALPLLHVQALRRCNLFKTNQTHGSQVALRAGILHRKPVVARSGYMWSDFTERQYGKESREARRSIGIENRVFSRAEKIVVTTPMMAQEIHKRIALAERKIRIIPNYVDTERFRPNYDKCRPGHIVYIGRLEKQKNVGALLEAVENTGITITIVGTGEEQRYLENKFGNLHGRLKWTGNLPHLELPDVIHQAQVFVLPSLYEGHPKTLLEAMACGVAVLGTNRPGIRELIRHNKNGYLCEPDAPSIRNAINELVAKPEACRRLGKAGRRDVEENYSLDQVVKKEIRMFSEILVAKEQSPRSSGRKRDIEFK